MYQKWMKDMPIIVSTDKNSKPDKPDIILELNKLLKTYDSKAKYGVESQRGVYADVAGQIRNIIERCK